MDKIRQLAPAKDITKILECSICSSVPIPPVKLFECREGKHIICEDCKNVNYDLCQCPSPWTDKRCFFGEKILESTFFYCKYDYEGCPMIIKGELYHLHLMICQYRPIICNIKTHEPCTNFPIHTRWYLHHLKQNHHTEGVTMETEDRASLRIFVNPERNDAQIRYIVFDQKQFLVYSIFQDECLYVWVTLLGNNHLNQCYNARIVFTTRDSTIENTTILPVYTPQTEFCSALHSSCAELPNFAIPPYLEKHSKLLPFVCTIENKNTPKDTT